MNTLRAGIHHIEFWVANLEESISFYNKLFSIIGWRKLNEVAYSTGENEIYLKSRPNRFQHDDFHLENIIVRDARYVGVVDFNGYDWGDPIHDFVKIALFARDISIPYSIGQIEGYFNGRIPEEFWNLYAVYVGMTVFSSVVWTLLAAPHMLDDMLERLTIVLEDHNNFELSKPIWFQPDKIDMT